MSLAQSVLRQPRSAAVRYHRTATLPAWPVLTLLGGFPVWYLTGLMPFIPAIYTIIFLMYLLGKRQLRLHGLVIGYAAFLAWALASVMMIDSFGRLIGFGQRYAMLMLAGLGVLYIMNARESISRSRLTGAFTIVWGTVVIGGVAGVISPEFQFTTPMGMLLPGAITSNELVHDWLFPQLAEIQTPWGAPEPFNRPSAPFPYANSWGSAIALLTPIAMSHLADTPYVKVRVGICIGFGLSLIPALESLNRGMLIGLGVAWAYVFVRSVTLDFRKLALTLMGAGFAVVGIALASGLVARISERQTYSDTTSGRGSLYEETLQRTMMSPLLGYGAPRPSNFHEIAAGTQGYIWTLMFSFGFVGLALFILVLCGGILSSWRVVSASELWLHAAPIVGLSIIAFYGLDTMQLLSIFLPLAVLLRDKGVRDESRA